MTSTWTVFTPNKLAAFLEYMFEMMIKIVKNQTYEGNVNWSQVFICIKIIVEVCFNSNVKIEPCYEPAEEGISCLVRKEGCSVGSDYVGIENYSIDYSHGDSEIK